MARKKASSSGRGSKKSGKSSKASNGRKRKSSSRQEFEDYSIVDPSEIPDGSDVLVDVPVVKVDELEVEVGDLHAQVAVLAEVRDIVQLSVGADARLGKVELKIEGVEAQALLKARLNNVTAILERVLTTLDRNPELLESVGQAVEEVGGGTRRLLGETGEAVEDVGEGAGGAVQDVGQGAGQAAGQIGQGANQALGQVGQGAGQAVGQVGKGAGEGVAAVGQGVQQTGQDLGGSDGGGK
jgi:hypothetical protein